MERTRGRCGTRGEAIRRFEQRIAADPRNPICRYHLGLAQSKSGETEQAPWSFQQAVKLNPGLTDAQQALGSLHE